MSVEVRSPQFSPGAPPSADPTLPVIIVRNSRNPNEGHDLNPAGQCRDAGCFYCWDGRPRPQVAFTRSEWAHFVAEVKTGKHDLP